MSPDRVFSMGFVRKQISPFSWFPFAKVEKNDSLGNTFKTIKELKYMAIISFQNMWLGAIMTTKYKFFHYSFNINEISLILLL